MTDAYASPTCRNRTLAPVKNHKYFEEEGMPCGRAKELVTTSGGAWLLCPRCDREGGYKVPAAR